MEEVRRTIQDSLHVIDLRGIQEKRAEQTHLGFDRARREPLDHLRQFRPVLWCLVLTMAGRRLVLLLPVHLRCHEGSCLRAYRLP